MTKHLHFVPIFLLGLVNCSVKAEDTGTQDTTKSQVEETGNTAIDTSPIAPFEVSVTVTLDGMAIPGVVLIQGGADEQWTTNAAGEALVEIDTSIGGSWVLHASHPSARIWAFDFSDPPEEAITIELTSFETTDNLSYIFQDPGTPEINDNTSYCSHCHRSMVEDWYASPHRQSASNPILHDIYSGTALNILTELECGEQGGNWWEGFQPGSQNIVDKCYIGQGALGALNSECGDFEPCDGVATATGECADCHAPGIDGELGGRDLHDASGIAYTYGVHCDVCHKVESIATEGAPGIAGKLQILRPTEDGPIGFDQLPLTFGPQADVSNIRMGAVHRDHYLTAEFCAGCHEYQTNLSPTGSTIDEDKWPEGLPVQSTFTEWSQGPYSPGAPCQSCHMPPDAEAGNSVDIALDPSVQGIASGWFRPAGSIRKHAWYGPRQPESRMLQMAAAIDTEMALSEDEATLTVEVTVQNVGAGHAIPTGEPMRSLILGVEAFCDQTALVATGGDVIPDFGGYFASKSANEDWTMWPSAQVGQVIRIIQETDQWHDYPGVDRVRDWTPSAKGMRIEHIVGQATIESVIEGQVTLSQALPAGDRAYLGNAGPIVDGSSAPALAGAPGFGFSRVMTGPNAERHIHHSGAVDIASDNRIMPQESWTSTHEFAATCEVPTVRTVLSHRAYPMNLALERKWELSDSVMVEATQ